MDKYMFNAFKHAISADFEFYGWDSEDTSLIHTLVDNLFKSLDKKEDVIPALITLWYQLHIHFRKNNESIPDYFGSMLDAVTESISIMGISDYPLSTILPKKYDYIVGWIDIKKYVDGATTTHRHIKTVRDLINHINESL